MTIRLIATHPKNNLRAEVVQFIKDSKIKATVWQPYELVIDLLDDDPAESMIVLKFPEFTKRMWVA